MTIAAVSPLEVTHPAGWTWQPETRRYRDPSTGRFTSSATVKQWRDTFLDRRQQSVRDLASALAAGWITSGSWREQIGEIQRESYGIMAALGRGGLNAMQPEDWSRVNAQLSRQQPYLERFAKEVQDGGLSEDQIGARSELYIGSAVQAFEAGRAAAWGDPDLPQLPGDGNTECGGNCRCSWGINPTDTAWECTWEGTNDERTCMGCATNQDTWDPLIIPYLESAQPESPASSGGEDSVASPPAPVGTVTNTETLTWTKTGANEHTDASGRFIASYKQGTGWHLIDKQTGTNVAIKTLSAVMARAEALATKGAVIIVPPLVVTPVVKPPLPPPPAVDKTPEKLIWDKKSVNYMTSRNAMWNGAPRFELQYQKGWLLIDNKTGERERFKMARQAQERATAVLKIEPVVPTTDTPEPDATGEPAGGKYVRILSHDSRVGDIGQVIDVELPPGGNIKWLWIRFADQTIRLPYTGNQVEVVKRPVDHPPEIQLTGMHLGSQVVTNSGTIYDLVGIRPTGNSIYDWVVTLYAPGLHYTTSREFRDINLYTPPPPPPPEPKVTADEAIVKLRDLNFDYGAPIVVARNEYERAKQIEVTVHQEWMSWTGGDSTPVVEKWAKASEAREIAEKKYKAALDTFNARIHKDVLWHAEQARFIVKYSGRWIEADRKRIDEEIDGFRWMVGRGRLDGITIEVKKTKEGRAFYTDNTINMPDHPRKNSVVHELGHWLEDRNSVAANLIEADYSARTSGESAQKLRDLRPGWGYDPGEISKPDKFRDPYMGKVYVSKRSHELLSMGMEQIYGDPVGLLNGDEATFRVTWEVLHSGSHVVPSSGAIVAKT